MTVRVLPSTASGPTTDGGAYADAVEASNAALWSQTTCFLTSIGGTGNAITAATDTAGLTPAAPILAYARNMRFLYPVATTNVPGTGVTFNIDGVGVRNCLTRGGNGLVGYEFEVGSIAELIYDGTQLRYMNHYKLLNRPYFNRLIANQNGLNSAAAQTWFPGGGATQLTLTDNTAYYFEGALYLTRVAGTTSHTIALTFGGTAILNDIEFNVDSTAGTAALLAVSNIIGGSVPLVVTAANAAGENNVIRIRGFADVTNGGTFAPQFLYSAAPGGVPIVIAGTYFKMEPWGSPKTIASNGPWS